MTVIETFQNIQNEMCTICREEFDGNEAEATQVVGHATNNNVNHLFHRYCLRNWLVQAADCPTCRTPLADNHHVVFIQPPQLNVFQQFRNDLFDRFADRHAERLVRLVPLIFCLTIIADQSISGIHSFNPLVPLDISLIMILVFEFALYLYDQLIHRQL